MATWLGLVGARQASVHRSDHFQHTVRDGKRIGFGPVKRDAEIGATGSTMKTRFNWVVKHSFHCKAQEFAGVNLIRYVGTGY